MRRFEQYVRGIELLSRSVARSGVTRDATERIVSILDGEVHQQLRRSVSAKRLKSQGAFFTHATLGSRAIDPLHAEYTATSSILDPACGAGDLLLCFARGLPLEGDLLETLVAWGRTLHGYDTRDEFVRAARARLVLLAAARHGWEGGVELPSLSRLFRGIQRADGLRALASARTIDWALLNPPYTYVTAPKDCTWSSGRTSAAALFVERCLRRASQGARIVAILPDVLRTGSRYRKWRSHVTSRSAIERIDVVGQFSELVEIDVFIVHLRVRANSEAREDWWRLNAPASDPAKVVGDYFDVRVGPVVPHRHEEIGAKRPYINAKSLPAWGTLSHVETHRRFSGRVQDAPFVAVRRTSGPSDPQRAVATIVTNREPVAVENHVITLTPKDNSTRRCRELLYLLRAESTTKWLNSRIRCRHLTVEALKGIPWHIEHLASHEMRD